MEQNNNKTGGIILIIGRPGAGKSPTAKEWAEKSGFKNKIVFDPRGEYDPNVYTIFKDFENFRNYVFEVKDAFIIFEEATGFVNAFKQLDLVNFSIGVEHNRSIIVFLFHGIMDTPTYLLRYCRFMILLQTNDDPEVIKRSRSELYPYLLAKKPVYVDKYK